MIILIADEKDGKKINKIRLGDDKSYERDGLDYHEEGKPGKIEIVPTKPYASQSMIWLWLILRVWHIRVWR